VLPTKAAENALLAPLRGIPYYPVGAHQIRLSERTWAALEAQCARSAGPMLYHDSTADVARDMDLLRRAVGDPVLNYVGLSYGTGLGVTYANLFPGTAGHIALDGNLDPVAWTRDVGGLPSWLRTGRDEATAAVLRDFMNLCGKASNAACAFSAGTPGATRAKYATLLHRLHRHPVTISTPPQTYTAIAVANSVPVDSVSQWQGQEGAELLQQLWVASATTGGTAASAAAAAAQLAFGRSGLVGPPLAWQTEPCAAWPAAAAQDRYAGPWNRPTASTILVLGITGDPITPHSVAMSRDLAKARLLTIRGYGHTEFKNPSTCATNYEVSYLLTGKFASRGHQLPPERHTVHIASHEMAFPAARRQSSAASVRLQGVGGLKEGRL
jgi:pimeloyl-ACP methyl ester carboxylesterase